LARLSRECAEAWQRHVAQSLLKAYAARAERDRSDGLAEAGQVAALLTKGGKSGLHRVWRWITSSGGDPRDKCHREKSACLGR
jgi:hypothetical protein